MCLLLQRSHLGAYILPWLCTVLLLMPVALAKSLQFSSCYYILTLGSIAERLFVSKAHLSRLFKRLTGEMFSDYLRKVRYSHACKLLAETDWTQVLDAPISAESREAFRESFEAFLKEAQEQNLLITIVDCHI